MKILSIVFAAVMLTYLGSTSVARATIVDVNEDWIMELQDNNTFTSIAHFIPDIPGIPDSLIFPQAPDWVALFHEDACDWDTALADEGKTAYLHGPAITNDTLSDISIFIYRLFYQWDDEDPNYNEDYPIILDVVVFNDEDIVNRFALRGIPNGPYDDPLPETTWLEEYDPESPDYKNPVPEPAAICLFAAGWLLLGKKTILKKW